MFRINQVVRCTGNRVGEHWRAGDLGVITGFWNNDASLSASFPLKVTHARRTFPNLESLQALRHFEPVTFRPRDQVRIVGFGPNNWHRKWANRGTFVGEIGRIGQVGAVDEHTLEISATLYSNSSNLSLCTRNNGWYWDFDPRQTIPEIIPYQTDEEFDVDFWRNLYLSHPNVVARAEDTEVDSAAAVSLEEPEPILPEPKKTKYDADY